MRISFIKLSFALAVICLYTYLFGIMQTIGEEHAGSHLPATSDYTDTAPPSTSTIDVGNPRVPGFADFDAPMPAVSMPAEPPRTTLSEPPATEPLTAVPATGTAAAVTTARTVTSAPATTSRPPATTPVPPPATTVTTTQASPSDGQTFRIRVNGNEITGDAFDIVSRVVQAEIGSSFHPEAIKAQAVAAYTYISYRNANGIAPNLPFASTASVRVQDATRAVWGQAIYHNGQYINAAFSASSAGWSSSARNVWGTDVAYLQSVRTEFDILHNDPNIGRIATFSSEEIRNNVRNRLGITLTGDPSSWLAIINRVDNVYVGQMSVGGQTTFSNNGRETAITGRVFRERVMGFGIRSASFTFEYNQAADSFIFTTNGYGHGVGMSQNGANTLANHLGYDYIRILTFYYTGVTVR
jgi:stage II sporulation protein D